MRTSASLFHKLGSYVLILFAAVHTAAFFIDPGTRLADEESKKVWRLMQTYQFQIEGTSFNISSMMRGFNWYLEIFTVGLGVLNLLIVKRLAGEASFRRPIIAVNVVMTGLLAVVTAIYFHILPVVLFGLSCIFFLLALFAIGKNS